MYKLAIVGGETHIEEVTSLRGRSLEITGVAVRSDQSGWAHERFGIPVFTDLQEMLRTVPADIVAIANENDEKAAVVLHCLERGKHVIVDKPMALSLEDVDRIERVAKAKDLRLLMLLTLRGNPWYREVRELVEAGTIGMPMQVYGRMAVELKREQRPTWFLDKRRSGGPILDLAIHAIDQVEWVTGLQLTKVTAYEANISDPEREDLIDSGAMLFSLSNGGTAMMEQNRVMPPGTGSDYRLDVVGTRGQLNLRLGKSITVLTEKGERQLTAADLGPSVSVVADWLNSLADSKIPIVPDRDSFRANRIACLAKRAADSGTTITIPSC